MATAATAAPTDAGADKGKVIRKKRTVKKSIDIKAVVGPQGVPKVLHDLSSVSFSKDNNRV